MKDDAKQALIEQLGSADNREALEAVERLREHGWLTDGSLNGLRLMGTNLKGANLQDADLGGVAFEQVDLENAVLDRANLGGKGLPWIWQTARGGLNYRNLIDSELNTLQPQRTFFWKVNLAGANLAGANLMGAILIDVDLSRANFHNARLQRVLLKDVDLSQSDLSNAWLGRIFTDGVKCEGAIFTKANLIEANLQGMIDISCDQLLAGRWLQDVVLPDGTKLPTAYRKALERWCQRRS